ncbi:hypothetical protein [Plastoroseomonas hellenica]|uniref:hypothetical protein n=1 Tax=Plastoroseomonas hellenica TaxID=2687306 RepID=UPI001BADEEA0|nr:hypothetical protein [Plastoroseomonas hellenica]MBR0646361.1 hypothetical protein [Plastoroseomonas hellenica]
MAAEHLASIESVEIPASRFTHRGYEFEVGLFPSPYGPGFEILLTDRLGVILMQGLENTFVPETALPLDEEVKVPLLKLRDWLQKHVMGLDEETFQRLLNTPRHRPEFRWSHETLDAVRGIDWDQPDETFRHRGHNFSVGHCTVSGGVLVVLRDDKGLFNGSTTLPAAEIVREAMQGRDLIQRGVAAMKEMVTMKTAAEVKDMISKPRVPTQPEAMH